MNESLLTEVIQTLRNAQDCIERKGWAKNGDGAHTTARTIDALVRKLERKRDLLEAMNDE